MVPLETSFDRCLDGHLCTAASSGNSPTCSSTDNGHGTAEFIEEMYRSRFLDASACQGLLESSSPEVEICSICKRSYEAGTLKLADRTCAEDLNAIYTKYSNGTAEADELISDCLQLAIPKLGSVAWGLHPLHYIRFNAAILLQQLHFSQSQWHASTIITCYILHAMKAGRLQNQPEFADHLEKLAISIISQGNTGTTRRLLNYLLSFTS
jgi:hypothetical protein